MVLRSLKGWTIVKDSTGSERIWLLLLFWPNRLDQRGPTSYDLQAFYKNLWTTSNKKMCKMTESHDLKLKREGKWVRHWNFCTTTNSNLLQISNSKMPVVEISLTLSYLYQAQYVSCSKSETVVQCFVCNSISVFRFDLLHAETVLHILSEFLCEIYSLGSQSLLTNFQNRFTVK